MNDFSVEAASEDDTHSLIQIHRGAFASDSAVRLMFRDEREYSTRLQCMIRSKVSDSRSFIIKAVKEDTGRVVGWLGFEHVGYPVARCNEKVTSSGSPKATTEQSKIAIKLRQTIQRKFDQKRDEWMSSKSYIHIQTLVIDPAYQRQGLGSALIHTVTSKADKDALPCWIESSSVARSMYHCAGFRAVDTLEIDLRGCAPQSDDTKQDWGPCEFIYMLRLPEVDVRLIQSYVPEVPMIRKILGF